MPPESISLLDRLLTLAPEKRIKAGEALQHPYLINVEPSRVPPPKLPTHQDCHEMWCKTQKRKKLI